MGGSAAFFIALRALRLSAKFRGTMMRSDSEQAGCFGCGAPALIGVLARVAGWGPEEFWAATPADVRAVLGGWADAAGAGAVDGAALAAMMEQFPDG